MAAQGNIPLARLHEVIGRIPKEWGLSPEAIGWQRQAENMPF